MSEEKQVVNEKVDSNKGKSKKTKTIVIIAITLIVSVLVLGIGSVILFGDEIYNGGVNKLPNNVSNAHRFSGEILFSQIIGDYSFVTEFLSEDKNVGDVNVNFLYKNEFVSNITVAENIDIEKCFDYSIAFKDYNNDGTIDFSHISSLGDEKSIYRLYTVTKEGKLIRLDENEYSFNSNKFSLKLDAKDGEYIYNETKAYYDGYEIGVEAGTYELNAKKVDAYNKVNGESKISFADNRKIEKPVFETFTSLADSFFAKHSLLKAYNEIEGIQIDLDSNGTSEKIICFYNSETNNTRIIMFDDNDEIIINFVNTTNEKHKLYDIIELLDIDNDGVTEIISKLPNSKEVTVSKYYLGYYFPEV